MNILKSLFTAFHKADNSSQPARVYETKAQVADAAEAFLDGARLSENEKYLAVKEIYRKYFEAVEKAEARSKPTDGLFGFGSSPKNSPCHEDFFNDLSVKLDDFIADGLSEQEAFVITAYILRTPAEYRNDGKVFPMLFAATGLAAKLADKLAPADAERLAIEYSKNFPKQERMPAQKKMLRALYDRAKT